MDLNEVTFTTYITPDSSSPDTFTVRTRVGGIKLDREEVRGYSFRDWPGAREIAQRLRRAIEAGAVFEPIEVLTDIGGKTYLRCDAKVWGDEFLESDLKALGF